VPSNYPDGFNERDYDDTFPDLCEECEEEDECECGETAVLAAQEREAERRVEEDSQPAPWW
jgi:hypothetical protein